MADIIELEKINEYVGQLVRITNISGAIVYGVDSNGNSVAISCATLTDTSALERRVQTVEGKAETNRTNIATLQTAVAGKANAVHTHTIANITDLQTTLDGKATTTALNALAGDVSAVETALSGKSNVGHSHAIADVINLQTALDGKAAANHTHVIANVEGLQTELDGKAAENHTHVIADVVDLQDELDGKAAVNHTHLIADVEGLQTELNGLTTAIASITQRDGFPQVSDLDGFEATEGTIAYYSGETTVNYTHGFIYQKVGNTWVNVDAQTRTAAEYDSENEKLTFTF